MKKCPNCQKTFDDNMKFCQTDGTSLVVVAEDAPPVDPYKTMVAGNLKLPVEEPEAAEPVIPEPEVPAPLDPYQTIVAGSSTEADDDDVLEIPDTSDPFRTVVAGGGTSGKIDIPDLAVDDSDPEPDSEKVENKKQPDLSSEMATMISPNIPKFSEPEIEEPELSDNVIPASTPEPPPPVEESFSAELPAIEPPAPTPISEVPPKDSNPSLPIPSPFDQSMPPGFAPPDTPPFAPSNEPYSPEPLNKDTAVPPASPFAEAENVSASSEPDPWESPANMAPAVPAAIEQDPFDSNQISNAPSAEGENNMLAYISLGLGIASFVCFLGAIGGLGAIITGYLAKKNIRENPAEYGGGTFATIGMILGGLAVFLTVIGVALWIVLMASSF